MPHRELLAAVATVLTFAAFVPYLRGILAGTTRPHVFSWVIWACTTLVVFAAQLRAGGGAGAWPIGVSGAIAAAIAALAWFRRGDVSTTRSDWLFFAAAMSSLPLWYATSDPAWAVVVLTVVDLLGFGPTLRKVYAAPYSENLAFYGLVAARNAIVVAALERHSVATVLFPAAIGSACAALIAIVAFRRRAVRAAAPHGR